MVARSFNVTGMTCEGCARTVEGALNALDGVHVQVCYESRRATISGKRPLALSVLREALAPHGYDLFDDGDVSRSGKEDQLHVAVIGSGSAAVAAALRLVERGARVTLIECRDVVGGTCVNVGCLPSKILLRAAEIQHTRTNHSFAGIARSSGGADRSALLAQLRARVARLRADKYQRLLADDPRIELIHGRARFEDACTLAVTCRDGRRLSLRPDRILIATGAVPVVPPIAGLAGTPFWTSAEALYSEGTPAHLAVIGSSDVAVELAQAYRRLGSEVTLLARTRLLSRRDPDLGAALQATLEAEGVRVALATEVQSVSYRRGTFVAELPGGPLRADRLLVATGRRPATEELDLNAAGIDTTSSGAIRVDDRARTTASDVYAVGDCADMPQLVYVAAAAGTRAAINMTGGDATLDFSLLPRVLFTDPQVATVGLDEREAHAAGIEAEVRKLELAQVPRGLVNFDTDGFIKLVAEAASGRLLGAQVLAHGGGEIIQTAALAIRRRMTVGELGGELFAYLTMSEGLKLCAQSFYRNVEELSCCAG